MNKTSVQSVIDYFTHGKCRCLKYNVKCFCGEPDRPVMLTDVLTKILDGEEIIDSSTEYPALITINSLILKWYKAGGCNLSLNELIECGFEEGRHCKCGGLTTCVCVDQFTERLKDKNVANLFEFLQSLKQSHEQ